MSEFHHHDEGLEARHYQAISKASVLSLLLGMGSFLAPVYVIFWVLPLAALLLGVSALRRIQRPDANLTGRRLAIAGILLALFFGSLAPARHYTRRAIVDRQAAAFSERWFDLMKKGMASTAHQLLMDPKQRMPTDLVLDEQYANDVKMKDVLKQFVSDEPIRTMLEQGKNARYERISTISHSTHLRVVTVKQLYHVHVEDEGGTRKIPLEFHVSCQYDRSTGQSYWTVSEVREAG